jgi:hypothetical protein
VDCFVRLAFVVLKKDLLVALELDDLPGLSRRYKQITAGFQNAAWALLAHYIYDLIDPTYDPTRAMQTWLRVADDRVELHSWYARIIQDDILTRSLTSASISSALLRFSALSLVDLAILVWRVKTAHKKNEIVQAAFSSLDDTLRKTLEGRFLSHPIHVSRTYIRPSKALPDIEIYRTSFFSTTLLQLLIGAVR